MYQPINCSLYDLLELLSIRKQTCQIKFLANDSKNDISGIITDLYSKNKQEFLVLDQKITIRLDQLVEVNGVLFNDIYDYPKQCGIK